MSNKLIKLSDVKKAEFKDKKNRFISVGAALVALGLLILGTRGILYRNNILVDGDSDTTPAEAKVLATSHVNETSYKTGDIPWQLYDEPFVEQESDYYIMNKDLLNQVDGNLIYAYMDASETYAKTLYEVDYRNIAEDIDAWVDSVLVLTADAYLEDGDEDLEADKKELYDLAEWYVDNEIVTEVSYVTDKSLVWQDLYYRAVRAQVVINVVGCKDNVEGNMFDIILPINKDFVVEKDASVTFMLDTEFDFTDATGNILACGYTGREWK